MIAKSNTSSRLQLRRIRESCRGPVITASEEALQFIEDWSDNNEPFTPDDAMALALWFAHDIGASQIVAIGADVPDPCDIPIRTHTVAQRDL